jgi:hypothetical protein
MRDYGLRGRPRISLRSSGLRLLSVIASEAMCRKFLDCFVAEPVVGPATSGRTRWLLAMTALARRALPISARARRP